MTTLLPLATIKLTIDKVWIGASKVKSSVQSKVKIKTKFWVRSHGRKTNAVGSTGSITNSTNVTFPLVTTQCIQLDTSKARNEWTSLPTLTYLLKVNYVYFQYSEARQEKRLLCAQEYPEWQHSCNVTSFSPRGWSTWFCLLSVQQCS